MLILTFVTCQYQITVLFSEFNTRSQTLQDTLFHIVPENHNLFLNFVWLFHYSSSDLKRHSLIQYTDARKGKIQYYLNTFM